MDHDDQAICAYQQQRRLLTTVTSLSMESLSIELSLKKNMRIWKMKDEKAQEEIKWKCI